MPLNMDKIAALYNGAQAGGVSDVWGRMNAPTNTDAADKVIDIPVGQLRDFPRSRFNRYKLHQGEKMDELVSSIRRNGILQPIVVRRLEDGDYQVVDGRNRREAARIAGYETVPCIVRQLDDEEAIQQLNFLNERFRELTPIEKAFIYQLEHEQTSRQGFRSDLTLYHDETKSENSEEDSRITKWRYRQLCKLSPDGLLDAVDKKLVSVSAAVELAALSDENQGIIYQFFFEEDCDIDGNVTDVSRKEKRVLTPMIAKRLKTIQDEKGIITQEDLVRLMEADEPQKYSFPAVKIKMRPLRKKFPKLAEMDQNEIAQLIEEALERHFSN